jgi:L-threonylcarbamoyladenylate synthase
VYGLAANAQDDLAVGKIYALKGRPIDHPLIVHVLSLEEVNYFAEPPSPYALGLIKTFWPGPLTLILPRKPGVAGFCAANALTIALRAPAHPLAQKLLSACKKPLSGAPIFGLAAPSANKFGRVSPTTAEHVTAEFGENLRVLDGGPCRVGIESAIVDCTQLQPVLLRPGMLTLEQISKAAGVEALSALQWKKIAPHALAPKASGTLASHYAPQAILRLLSLPQMRAKAQTKAGSDRKIGVWVRDKQGSLVFGPSSSVIGMPSDAATCAQALFAQLRAFDSLGVDEIWVETPPNTPEWQGITDRLQRAAHSGTEAR